MAIRGVTKKAIPYVLEDDRSSPLHEQTVFHIVPKTGHDNNKTVQRYAAAAKENRKGYREVNVSKMDAADHEEFISVVEKVENYIFPEDHSLYKADENGEPVLVTVTEAADLKEVARTLSADHLAEVLEVSNNVSKLKDGEKKSYNS